MTRFTGVTRLSALFAVVAAAACSPKSETQQDTAMTPADTAVAPSTTASTTPAATGGTASSTKIVPININTASDAEILRIPGVGPRMLREFKEYRPYTSIEQFRREIGKYVDKAEVARLEQYIVIK